MDKNYSEFAPTTIFCARYEAHTHGASAVGPEHVILGLVRADRQLFELCAPKLNADQVRDTLESRLPRSRMLPRKSIIPLSRATKRVLILAKKESDSSGYTKIRTEHILAGLIRPNDYTGWLCLDSVAGHTKYSAAFKLRRIRSYGIFARESFIRVQQMNEK